MFNSNSFLKPLNSDGGDQDAALAGPKGLFYIPDLVSVAEEIALLSAIDAQSWLLDLRRRVQHYGFRYDYKARKLVPSMYLGPLPEWTVFLVDRLVSAGHMPERPDQMIVNEYLPGQGISTHVDCVPCFGPAICSLSLGSQCVMDLTSVDADKKTSVVLERRSALVLADEARYKWRHAIAGRKTDRIQGLAVPRGRRVSLTFRKALVSATKT